ncbi:hypothetical protein HaLaN_04874, partial [Haematococcus lacustris]
TRAAHLSKPDKPVRSHRGGSDPDGVADPPIDTQAGDTGDTSLSSGDWASLRGEMDMVAPGGSSTLKAAGESGTRYN